MQTRRTRNCPDGYASKSPQADNLEAAMLMTLQGLELVRDALVVYAGIAAKVRELEREKGGEKSDTPKRAA